MKQPARPSLAPLLLMVAVSVACSKGKGGTVSPSDAALDGPPAPDALVAVDERAPVADTGGADLSVPDSGSAAADLPADRAPEPTDVLTGMDAPVPVSCPVDPNVSEPCATLGNTCTVKGACCVCQVVPSCSAARVWVCVAPASDPACGTAPAVVMSACPSDRHCAYCVGELPVARDCAGGRWVEGALRVCR